ncbi:MULTISPECIES: isochorismatase family protein [unclassified Variovorax]|uniref:isochorismatase family protein n=1 Tax=unclassified Variovorax TaxID=663243 RepID=UPI001315FE24|nr:MULTISPECIES: isochorismatase family protein [unclassified Variovorax]VTU28442.1 Peroxyureidoacrylate/ureidoacrylate amidohydrolase RutB [Variovorax sp. SRS16]VTU36031.1 Peroxyureidoacrylate/ureidoacrylate amidohydrolase RutB [Variovorax sp. PBL-E5]
MTLDNLDTRNSALLVIDLQNAFVHDKGTLGISGVDTKRLSAIVPTLAELIPRCQAAGIPVIWTVQEHFAVDASRAHKKLAGHTSRRKQVSALAGTWDEEIVEELKPLAAVNPSYVIRKHRFGAFYETRLEMMLKMLGTRTLFIAGTTTNACVETSIREAYLRDYDVVALDDCISGVNGEWEATAKKVWKQYFCEISDSKEMLGWIEAQSAPRALGYGHMLMMVQDVPRSTAFYVDQLGFSIRPAKPLADGRPFTAFHQGVAIVGGRAASHKQIDHMAFEVNDVRALRERLKKTSVEFQEDLHDGPYGLTIYVTDPDGTRIELYQVGAKV